MCFGSEEFTIFPQTVLQSGIIPTLQPVPETAASLASKLLGLVVGSSLDLVMTVNPYNSYLSLLCSFKSIIIVVKVFARFLESSCVPADT